MNNEGLNSNWGGARVGAGRKAASTKGKQIWIPADLVSQVEQLVKDYKASSPTLAHPTRMRGHVRREGDGGKKQLASRLDDLSPYCNTGDSNIREDLAESLPIPSGYVKATRKELDRLPVSVRRQLIKQFGTLTNALNYNLYTNGKKVLERVGSSN